jgi:hypothetical protein
MLQEVLEYIHNYFIRTPIQGKFTLTEGTLTPEPGTKAPELQEGQRFWIVGSVFNDGVYTWRSTGIMTDDDDAAAGLQPETFAGTICALAVPPAVIALAEEIKTWVDKNSDALNGPYQSESFNGYSYTLKSGGTGGNGSGYSWQDQFGKRLERWRRPFL